ncbi:MAG: hypothetical protein ACRD8O_05055 [Bryobacteraceae bacterium]
MSTVSSLEGEKTAAGRPIVKGLFVASCLLSIVSWYTTQQGMALYLSAWFAFLASLGVQIALVLVAWLIGFTRTRRTLLISVYTMTAVVSIAFSYVSLHTWFAARERPANIQRKLYDLLQDASGRAEGILTEAAAEGQKHVLALDEMTAAEKSHGFIARAQDADPYLAKVRDAVAREAQTYSESYREGAGAGLRYTAFDRYAKLAHQSIQQIQQAQSALAGYRAATKPLDPSEKQLRAFHQVYDTIPWSEAEQHLHRALAERPALPAYADYVDQTASSQEDLMIAFRELLTAPAYRHVFAFGLAAFIDVIIFLLAYASGPFLFGPPEQRWVAGGAAVDGTSGQVFVRDFLRKTESDVSGLARVDTAALSPGERQLCMTLAARELATTREESGRLYYVLDPQVQEKLLDALTTQGLAFRVSATRAAAAG